MSEEDINFLISIQDLEQPEFDNVYLERENERLRNQLQQKENIIKEIREYIEKNTKEGPIKDKRYFYSPEQANDILEILDKGE